MFSRNLAVRILYLVLGFANSFLLARVLGVQDYGFYTFCLSIIAILCIPAQLGFPTLLTKEFAASRANGVWGETRGLVKFSHMSVLFVSIFLMLFLSGYAYWSGADYTDNQLLALCIAGGLIPLLSLGALRDSMLRGMHYVIASMLAENVVRPVFFFVLLSIIYLSGQISASLPVIMFFYIIFSLIAFMISWAFYFKNRPLGLKNAHPELAVGSWMKYVFPVGMATAFQVVNAQLSFIVLGVFVTPAEVGVYRIAVLFSGIVTIFLQVVDSYVGPKFSEMYVCGQIEEINKLYRKVTKIVFFATTPLVIFLCIAAPILISGMYGATFSTAITPMFILVFGQFFVAISGPSALLLLMSGHQKDALSALMISFAVNVLLHAILVGSYGIIGVAVSNCVMLILWKIILTFQVRKRFGMTILQKIESPRD
ncbi:Uncharacterised protein [BD1-7 clade bacterium]|uniref:Uncharacterized protein n=1 Tax=BD1-7 clade bacterium TaxID=2029982 RepID=A0A5S9MUJ5_9GAMM|nr:Uncharacterised protein [BD1-7 clade bacterium]